MPRRRGGGSDFLDALPSDGERRLMLAVLIDAMRALLRHWPAASPHPTRALLREQAWFKSDDHRHPFSFINICGALGLNADYIRRCVLGRADSRGRLRLRRYAATVEESWLRQRRSLSGLSADDFDHQSTPGAA